MKPNKFTRRCYLYTLRNHHYLARCRCLEKNPENPKRKFIRKKKPLLYPDPNERISKTFQIKYEKNLSSTAKLLLKSFQYKYLYYAIDDILDLLKSDPIEQDDLLSILYSPVLSLQNNFFIDFFNIWISEIYITKAKKRNKFLLASHQDFESENYITITFIYRLSIPVKKLEPLW